MLLKTHPAGLINPKQRGLTITFLYRGAINPIVKWLAPHNVKDIAIRDRDFDGIFLIYKDRRGGSTMTRRPRTLMMKSIFLRPVRQALVYAGVVTGAQSDGGAHDRNVSVTA